jgi:hypothetical protein
MMSRLRPLRKNNLAPMLALGLAAGLLAACSSTQMTDMIPTAAGGLPENAPTRPAAAPEYPAVNAMPQRREALPLTDDEIKRTQAEMTTLRQQQEQRAAEAEPKPAVAPAKKTAAAKPAKKSKEAKPKPAAELTAKDAAK